MLLEAQRLGLRAVGSDLNPVAVLISKALVEIPAQFRDRLAVNPDRSNQDWLPSETCRRPRGLAEDVRYYGRWVREQAERQIGHMYPHCAIARRYRDACGRMALGAYGAFA